MKTPKGEIQESGTDMKNQGIEVALKVDQGVDPQSPERSKHLVDFYIAGFTYWDGPFVAQELKIGDRLSVRHECNNQFDPNAVAIYYRDKKLGYIPRTHNAPISQFLSNGYNIYMAIVTQINLEVHPERQVRVAIRLKDAQAGE